MKYLFSMFAVFVGVLVFNTASAATVCSAEVAQIGDTVVVCGGGNPATLQMSWGLSGGETPKVKAGASFSDEKGYSDNCPSWYFTDCYDLTKTDWYKNQMRGLAKSGFYTRWLGF